MNVPDTLGALEQALGDMHPEIAWVAVRADPRILVWGSLLAQSPA